MGTNWTHCRQLSCKLVRPMSKAFRQASARAIVGVALLGVLLVLLAWQASVRSVDFPVYHRIARQVLAGDYELYPPEVYTGAVVPPHGFRYLPVVALLFVPFGLLPLPVAAFVFFVIKLAVLAWIGRAVAAQAGLMADGWRWPLVGLLLVAGYVAEELRYGNAHLLVVGLMVLAWLRASRGETWLPGAALALAIATKITPLALLGYMVLRRQFAACAVAVAALGVLVVAPVPLVGGAMNAHLLTGFVRYAFEKTEESDNYSLRGALERLSGSSAESLPMTAAPSEQRDRFDVDAVTVAWAVSSGVLGALALVVLWRQSTDPRTNLLEFSLVLVLMLVVSPHTQRRYFMQLYVPVVALLGMMSAGARRERTLARLGLGVTAAAGTLLPIVFGGRTLSRLYESSAPYLWGAVVLLAVLLQMTWERKRAETTDDRELMADSVGKIET